jgi:hypothetical protein
LSIEIQIGYRLVLHQADGQFFQVEDILIGMVVHNWCITSVSKVDVWNWFDMWPGSDPPLYVRECIKAGGPDYRHKFVNVSFMGLDMRCKFCDLPEATHCNQKEREHGSK